MKKRWLILNCRPQNAGWLGIWSKTNWDKLPVEREAQRKDDDEANLAIGNNKLKPGDKINPNEAARDELMKLPGIGEEMANRIIEAREQTRFARPEDLQRVPGSNSGRWTNSAAISNLKRHENG